MFDDLSDVFEASVEWPKRLAHEAPFYRRWFERAGVGSVVDVACGPGRHAAMFHDWGLRVEGADISPNMIARAKAMFGESDRLHWAIRGFDEPTLAAKQFDAAICVGNSLALAADRNMAERAIRQMLAMVPSGGLVVIHVLNLWSLPDGPCRWQKCKQVTLPSGAAIILRGVHRCGSRGYVELAAIAPSDDAAAGTASLRAESTPLLGFEAADLERMARDGGAVETNFFGGYQDQPYDREKSTDLILVARSGGI
jgi:SAM-dependent methyltransferase